MRPWLLMLCACGRIGFDDQGDRDASSGDGSGAIMFVQEATNTTGGASSLTVTLPAAVGDGDLLVLAASTDSFINGISAVTGGGASWLEVAKVGGLGPNCTGCIRGAMWYGLGATGGDNLVTITFVGTDDLAVSVSEWSGVASLETSTISGPGTTMMLATGAVTTSHPRELVFAMGAWDKAVVADGPTNGFVPLQHAAVPTQSTLAPAVLMVPIPSSVGTGWTLSTTTQAWVGIIATFTAR